MNKKYVCPKCKHPSFTHNFNQSLDKRPTFVCQKCDYFWQYGLDGGPYLQLSQGLEILSTSTYVLDELKKVNNKKNKNKS